jgi:hypothetical protein
MSLRVARVAVRAALPAMRRSVVLGMSRRTAASASTGKFVEIYKSDFENEKYPIALPGGAFAPFAKLLYKFADVAENKNFAGYGKGFDVLRTLKDKIGPMWPLEEDLWRSENAEVKKLPEGFRFVISWMQNTQNMKFLPQVEAGFRELVDEREGTTTAFLTFAKFPADAELAKAQKEAESTFTEAINKRKVNWVTLIDPTLISGYTANVDSDFIDKSGRGQELASASNKEAVIDYTRVPLRPYRKTPNLGMEGAAFVDAYSYLQGLDEAEWTHGY